MSRNLCDSLAASLSSGHNTTCGRAAKQLVVCAQRTTSCCHENRLLILLAQEFAATHQSGAAVRERRATDLFRLRKRVAGVASAAASVAASRAPFAAAAAPRRLEFAGRKISRRR